MENKKIYFIDVVYYNCYAFYRRYEKDLNEFSGQALTSLCISLNLVTLIILIQEFSELSFFENKWYTLLVSLPVLMFTIIRYNRHINIEEIEDSLNNKERYQVKKLNFMAFIYVIISIFAFLILMIILGEMNNPPTFWSHWFN